MKLPAVAGFIMGLALASLPAKADPIQYCWTKKCSEHRYCRQCAGERNCCHELVAPPPPPSG